MVKDQADVRYVLIWSLAMSSRLASSFQFLVSPHPPALGFQVGTAGDVAMPGHKESLLVGRYYSVGLEGMSPLSPLKE